MAQIVNLTTDTILISDLLDNGVTQYQDGVKTFTLGPSATATISNLQAANSVSVKTLLDAGTITVNLTVEPSNIIGMDNI